MLITRTSLFDGKIHTWEIDITEEQLLAWKQGMLIQRAMPNLSADEREFIMTGMTPQQWDETFSKCK